MQAASIKTESDIAAMRISGRICAEVLRRLRSATRSGMTPKNISKRALKLIDELGGHPVLLGFEGYPDVICISVNDQVQHAIPDARAFRPGDIVNYDLCVSYEGMITDAGITFCVDNKFTPDTSRLLEGTEQALEAALGSVKAGCRVGDISAVIEQTLRRHHLGIVHQLTGHGVGYFVHEDPDIPNLGRAGTGPILNQGMTIAIEPIATLGRPGIYQEEDGWTLRTSDGSWAAQFEHTVLVTEDGCEILTV